MQPQGFWSEVLILVIFVASTQSEVYYNVETYTHIIPITDEDNSVTFEEDEVVHLVCRPPPLDGIDDCTFSWSKDDVEILSLSNEEIDTCRTESILELSPIKEKDQGKYTCMLQWRDNGLVDERIYYSVSLQVQRRGFEDPSVAIKRTRRQLDQGIVDENGKSKRLISASNTSEVSKKENPVAGYPHFTKETAKFLAKPEGATVTLKCSASGNPTPNITWYKDGLRPTRFNGTIRYKKWTMKMEECTPSDQGNYTCVVCNIYGCIQNSFDVTIIVSATDSDASDESKEETPIAGYPRFTRKYIPRFLAKPAGATVTLRCSASGNPPPNITWYKDGIPPNRFNGTIKYKKWAMEMEECTPLDQGNYTCVVCNIHGCIQSSFTVKIVEVRTKLTLTITPQNQTVALGDTANFTCNLPHHLGLYVPIGWFHGSICNDQEQFIRQSLLSNNSMTTSQTENFTIHNVTHEHEGWYSCAAVNNLGVSCSSAYLTVLNSKL